MVAQFNKLINIVSIKLIEPLDQRRQSPELYLKASL